MKKLVLLFALAICVTPAFAENLYQTTNPFPQTSPQTMNNLYEAQPAVIQREEAKKQEKQSFFSRFKKQDANKNELPTYPVHEGIQNDGSFYVFK